MAVILRIWFTLT